MRAKDETQYDRGIVAGMAMAAAIIVRTHDSATLALEILEAAGIADKKSLTSIDLENYDLEPLLRILKR